MRVTVRQGEPGDLEAVRRVARRAWEAAYGDVLAGETIDRAMDEWYSAEVVRERLSREAGLFLVATPAADTGAGRGEDDVVGYVDGLLRDGDAVIGALNVHPDWWREGAGGRLLDRAVPSLAEQGASRARARALADNDVGRSFYESRGYVVVERGEDHLFGETVPAVTYARELSR
jgi:ribosomal protein S18 acetylase RimI-like enzyme